MNSPEKKNMVVLLSGSGTTLQNLIDRIENGQLSGWQIKRVISSRSDAYGLVRARNHNIPTSILSPRDFSDTETFSARVFETIGTVSPDLVVMAGWMNFLIIPPEYENRVMNVHPALIPAFCGKGMYGHHVHEAVVEKGVKVTGCTVHFVDNAYDHGPIILQRVVEIDHSMTPDDVAQRVQAAEREAYPQAIRWFGEGRLRVESHRVIVDPN